MYRLVMTIGLLLFLTACSKKHISSNTSPPSINNALKLTKLVNPHIGTAAHGHTYPGATAPFGMVQLSPDTRLTGWDGCSGYHYTDSIIYGFSHTHLSGTGVSDYGDILLMPMTDQPTVHNGADGRKGYRSTYKHEKEVAEPGYYSVFLEDPQVQVDLTVTPRAGFHRYHFPKDKPAHVILDLAHRDKVISSEVNFLLGLGEHAVELVGHRISNAWATEQHIYFVVQFSQPAFARMFIDGKEANEAREYKGEDVRTIVILDEENRSDEPLLVKVGISAVSVEAARKNLETEIPHWDFEKTKRETQQAWEKELRKITIEGGTPDQQSTFYTALYHSFLNPNLFSDVDGQYRGMDKQIYTAKDRNQYTVFSLWDTYRATHPLFTLTQQKRTNEFIKTFADQYDKGGIIPIWELAGNYTGCMIGYHAIPVIADAYIKGIADYDAEYLLEAMKVSAIQDKLGLKSYKKLGFIPADKEGESVAKTLEYAYDDWCIAQMAKAMGKKHDYQHYLRRAQSWKNVFDPNTGFMRAKMHHRWFAPFDPAEVNFNYTEANAWQYSFYVPQDIEGFMDYLGGEEALSSKLDELFAANSATSGRKQVDITGLIGQYAHGNEPSHHIAYLYNYTREPWKTQARVRNIMDDLYFNAPDGLSGNEDCGQMSAWYVFSAMGFYPVTPASDQYAIGSPLFEKATIHLENGKEFSVIAKGVSKANKYIQKAWLNGEEWDNSYMTHQTIMAGGNITFEMGATPNKSWAVKSTSPPTSSITEALITPVPYIEEGDQTFYETAQVALACVDKKAQIYYTLDGSAPSTQSTLYEAPFTLSQSGTLQAIAVKNGQSSAVIRSDFKQVPVNRSTKIISQYAPQYAAGGDRALIDFVRGPANWHTGMWQGYEGQNLEVVVDLGAEQDLEAVHIGFLQDENAWIFMPLEVQFYTSDNGENFSLVGETVCHISPKEKGVIVQDFGVPIQASTRYVKVIGVSRITCPRFHKGAGGKCWVFADEIVIQTKED